MKRILVSIAIAIAATGCGSAVTGRDVQLVTTAEQDPGDTVGCYLTGPTGTLVTDPTYGTALLRGWSPVAGPQDPAWTPAPPEPVAWPHGYTARWVGSQIDVLDAAGARVATTGQRYEIASVPWSPVPEENGLPEGFTGHVVGCIYPR